VAWTETHAGGWQTQVRHSLDFVDVTLGLVTTPRAAGLLVAEGDKSIRSSGYCRPVLDFHLCIELRSSSTVGASVTADAPTVNYLLPVFISARDVLGVDF
jgi:hypothetical protein